MFVWPRPARDIGRICDGNLTLTKHCGVDLRDTLVDFRAKHGWDRAIAAPQIGVLKRIVYLQTERSWLIINPRLTGTSKETMELCGQPRAEAGHLFAEPQDGGGHSRERLPFLLSKWCETEWPG